MSSEAVQKVTTAFNPTGMVDTFVSMAPFILGVAGILLVVGIVSFGFRRVRRRLSGGMG